MSKAWQEVLIGVILVVLAGGLLIYALVVAPPHPAMVREPLGPLGWPVVILVGLICLSLVLIGRGWLEKHRDVRKGQVTTSEPYALRVTLGIMAASLLYILVLPVFGFALTTLFWLLVTLYIFGTKRLILLLGLSAGTTVMLCLLFLKVMPAPLPRGMWIFESFSRLIGH